MRKILTILLTAITLTATAQTAREDFKRDRNLAGSNHRAYPTPTEALTPSPKDYEPVYFSHYGRHGSRYHIGEIYTKTDDILTKADRLGILTPKGKDTAMKVRMLREEAKGRDGELTELGAEQHRQIAERMYKNFPEIFSKPIHIDAKSTVIIRCILSMENALQQLKSMNPQLDIRHDASEHDMYFMNQNSDDLWPLKVKNKKAYEEFGRSLNHPERLMRELFTDEAFWRDSIDAKDFTNKLFGLTNNLQSSELRKKIDMWDLFTDEEIYNLWQGSNAFWYVSYGPSPLSGGIQQFSQRNLLRKIICEADSCLALNEPTAHLRYGHDTMVMPLVVLLDIDGYDRQISDLATLATHEWCDYRIFPMACNLQFVFYKNKKNPKAPVLIKVLHNEHEAHLPLKTNNFPYYKYEDFRQYYLNKLDGFKLPEK